MKMRKRWCEPQCLQANSGETSVVPGFPMLPVAKSPATCRAR
jgi:hypothetical protein